MEILQQPQLLRTFLELLPPFVKQEADHDAHDDNDELEPVARPWRAPWPITPHGALFRSLH